MVWRGFGKVLVARHDAQIERPGTSLRKNETSSDAPDALIVGLTRPEASVASLRYCERLLEKTANCFRTGQLSILASHPSIQSGKLGRL